MKVFELSIALLLSGCGLVIVYVAFLANEIFSASATNRAVGIGVLLKIPERPLFWVLGAAVVASILYAIRH